MAHIGPVSGTGAILKVGGGEHTSSAKRRKFFVVPLYFLALQVGYNYLFL